MSFYELIDFDHLFPNATERAAEHARFFYSGIAAILYGCFLGPLAEEIGFRGVLLSGLLKTRCRPWLAILISALCFGLLHGLIGFPSAFLFGILVGWLYWRTSSIIPGIIIHIVNNSLSFIDLSGQCHAVCLLILFGSLILLTLVLRWFGKKCNFANHYN
ncbi:MAG: CPBP family intramembrane metalloprotease [Bacteroidales bacterium]|nr:CPBP family intramembrane metalloprotease [Bacteroidales bacterium]